MNEADLTRLQRGDLATLCSDRWELMPEVSLRQRCLELAVDVTRGRSYNANVSDESIVVSAKKFYEYITGDLSANLHGTKQDQR